MKSAGDVEVVGKCVTSCIVGLWVMCWKGVGKVLEAPPHQLNIQAKPTRGAFNALSMLFQCIIHSRKAGYALIHDLIRREEGCGMHG